MDAMGEEDISHYTDHYREALEEVIAAKAEGKQPAPAVATEPAGQVVDLMAALNASVAQARESRGEREHAAVHEMPKPKKTAKKTTAKKATAKKTTTKKTTAKKATARRNPRAS
jgi:DNA end-binding protein Ku